MKREQLITHFLERMGEMRRLMMGAHVHTSPARVSHAQFALLACIAREGKSVKALAGLFGMTSSAITQMVNSLVRDKLVSRRADPDDRRKILLSLTKQGQRTLEHAKQERKRMFGKVLAPLSDQELEQLASLQEKILVHLRQL